MNEKKILVTGGAGYIGSHTLLSLNNAGYGFIVYDNLCNASKESLVRVEELINKSVKWLIFSNEYIFDLENDEHLELLHKELRIEYPQINKNDMSNMKYQNKIDNDTISLDDGILNKQFNMQSYNEKKFS